VKAKTRAVLDNVSQRDGDRLCGLVVHLLTDVRSAVKSERLAPADYDLSTGKSQGCDSGYPQALPAKMEEPGEVAPSPAPVNGIPQPSQEERYVDDTTLDAPRPPH